MKKLLAFAAAATAAGLFSVSANAGLIDFANEADTNGERGVVSGSSLIIDGVNIQLDVPSNSAWFPYFDSSGTEGPAGLGVCQNLNLSNKCVPSSDDNVTVSEDVKVTFLGGSTVITGLSFRGEGHVDYDSNNTNTLRITTSAGFDSVMTFAAAVAAAAGGTFGSVSWIAFHFVHDATGALLDDDQQFYVRSISTVPIPGALPLLLSGLAGLGFASRRRRKAA